MKTAISYQGCATRRWCFCCCWWWCVYVYVPVMSCLF